MHHTLSVRRKCFFAGSALLAISGASLYLSYGPFTSYPWQVDFGYAMLVAKDGAPIACGAPNPSIGAWIEFARSVLFVVLGAWLFIEALTDKNLNLLKEEARRTGRRAFRWTLWAVLAVWTVVLVAVILYHFVWGPQTLSQGGKFWGAEQYYVCCDSTATASTNANVLEIIGCDHRDHVRSEVPRWRKEFLAEKEQPLFSNGHAWRTRYFYPYMCYMPYSLINFAGILFTVLTLTIVMMRIHYLGVRCKRNRSRGLVCRMQANDVKKKASDCYSAFYEYQGSVQAEVDQLIPIWTCAIIVACFELAIGQRTLSRMAFHLTLYGYSSIGIAFVGLIVWRLSEMWHLRQHIEGIMGELGDPLLVEFAQKTSFLRMARRMHGFYVLVSIYVILSIIHPSGAVKLLKELISLGRH